MSSEFICPHCERPWDQTEAAVKRMKRIVDGTISLEDDLLTPGFMIDLRALVEAVGRKPQRVKP